MIFLPSYKAVEELGEPLAICVYLFLLDYQQQGTTVFDRAHLGENKQAVYVATRKLGCDTAHAEMAIAQLQRDGWVDPFMKPLRYSTEVAAT